MCENPYKNQAFPDIAIIIEYSLNGLVPNSPQKSHYKPHCVAVKFVTIP